MVQRHKVICKVRREKERMEVRMETCEYKPGDTNGILAVGVGFRGPSSFKLQLSAQDDNEYAICLKKGTPFSEASRQSGRVGILD